MFYEAMCGTNWENPCWILLNLNIFIHEERYHSVLKLKKELVPRDITLLVLTSFEIYQSCLDLVVLHCSDLIFIVYLRNEVLPEEKVLLSMLLCPGSSSTSHL